MRLILMSLVVLSIVSCKSAEQKKDEEFLNKIINQPWEIKVPYDDLLTSSRICSKNPDYDWCDIANEQVIDISITYNSCINDQRSRLCKAIIKEVSGTLLFLSLPKIDYLNLPSSPFYLSLPTELLRAKSSQYDFREETIQWLWLEIKLTVQIISLIALTVLFCLCFNFFWKKNQKNKAMNIEIAMICKRDSDEKERIRVEKEFKEIQAKQARAKKLLEDEEIAKLELQERIAIEKQVLADMEIAKAREKTINQEREKVKKALQKRIKGTS